MPASATTKSALAARARLDQRARIVVAPSRRPSGPAASASARVVAPAPQPTSSTRLAGRASAASQPRQGAEHRVGRGFDRNPGLARAAVPQLALLVGGAAPCRTLPVRVRHSDGRVRHSPATRALTPIRGSDTEEKSDGVPEPLRGADPARMRGLGGDVPYYARFDEGRREADEGRFWFWNSMHFPSRCRRSTSSASMRPTRRSALWQNRVFAVPLGAGHRLPLRQRLHLHLRQPGPRSREGGRARPGVRRSAPPTTTRTGTSSTPSGRGAHAGPDRRGHRSARARPARVRGRRGRVRRRR